ncbi:peptide chain release factor N(5)-glutamine methyltransferase [Coraliomargarita akajimensis]|uniref:Release factor glutamine methyltransferase n=1 Tax=Coraliomargarita akajimensis (strain DSM 45221 / IAM 15411 / JCM 23193 / KCTC 12865 / 04OKA010-24) TaxID=583355 RepID=D5ELE2_CORAD|nr:peptide chain release factor N(5)-glutamine methyltransferase [Coraliomargarita akajimensis]ADE55078.1 protein-(glutamine-N5) methyltransferase, release factor-specific [Coraliomargarita akajimensis DSM 45221]
MLTLREIKQRTQTFFEQKGVPNAKLDTDLLIAHSLGIKRLDIYLDLERPLTDAQLDDLRPLVKRRASREPLQYILGSVEFAGLELKTDVRALIPRPETEELVELLVQRLQRAPTCILDLGTGTGALALALAKRYSDAAVTAVDLSAEALTLAAENAEALDFSDRVRLLEGSWFVPLPESERFDLIVSNPPYLTEEEMTTAEPEVVGYEPHSALVSGVDGLDDLRTIFAEAKERLNEGGLFAVETGISQHDELLKMAKQGGFEHAESVEDLSGRSRFVFCW